MVKFGWILPIVGLWMTWGLPTASVISRARTRMFVGYLRDHLGVEILEAVLDLAGETRPIELLLDDAQWNSYGQFRRLLEAASTVLGGSSALADFGAVVSFTANGNPEYVDMFQAFGSPGALYA